MIPTVDGMRGAGTRLCVILACSGIIFACGRVCEVARVTVVASDGRTAVPCVVDLQGADQPVSPPRPGGGGVTGGLLVFHANRVSGTYKLAIQCEGYKLTSSPPFKWTMAGTGCGKPADLGSLVVTADDRAAVQGR